MVAISENGYIDKVDDIIDKYSNTYYRTTTMKSIDVETSTYIRFEVENNDKHPKFKTGNYMRKSKYINIFSQGYTPNWSEEIFCY